ncbi:hypothetical protein EOL96_04185 [Candidatus Saccharibacteria bacterium]|nr:hypothetical protein [Candidatus Saccharibacteria bacterium]
MKLPIKQSLALSASVIAVVGLVVAPMTASAVTDGPDGANVTLNIGPTLTMSVSNTATFSITPDGTGVASSNNDTVTVSTNNSTGYKLQLKDLDATTTLGSSGITAHTGTAAVPTALTTVNTWGYRLDGGAGFGAGPTTAQTNVPSLTSTLWAGITASWVDIKTTNTTASNEANQVFFAALANSTIPTGSYVEAIQYQSVTN